MLQLLRITYHLDKATLDVVVRDPESRLRVVRVQWTAAGDSRIPVSWMDSVKQEIAFKDQKTTSIDEMFRRK